MTSERKDGHSKLVYNKERRTIDKVDPHPMTGDGAVVRELAARLDRAGWPLHHEARELIQQQAAEIERLTERAITSLRRADAHRARAEASEARTAALLKALERYGVHQWPCSKKPASVPCTCGLAAAKGAV